MRSLRQCAHFHGVGSVGAAVNLGTLWLVHGVLGVWVYAAMVLAFSTSNFTSFVAVKKWTFKENCWMPRLVLRQWTRFYSVALTGLGLNILLFAMLHDHVGLGVYASQCTALMSVAPFHFYANKAFTFTASVETDAEPDPAH